EDVTEFCIRDQASRLTYRKHFPSHKDLTTYLGLSFHSSHSFKLILVMCRVYLDQMEFRWHRYAVSPLMDTAYGMSEQHSLDFFVLAPECMPFS
ncbi:hypothetical protein Tco_1187113, partial [Tanacetum coccineum]